jgi:hypothetical protein
VNQRAYSVLVNQRAYSVLVNQRAYSVLVGKPRKNKSSEDLGVGGNNIKSDIK